MSLGKITPPNARMKNILIALALTFVVVTSIQLFSPLEVAGVVVVAIYLILYAILQWQHRFRKQRSFPHDTAPDRSSWPLSGPFRRLGPTFGGCLFLCVFWITNILSIFNPFQLVQIIRQMIGNARLEKREKRTGESGVNYKTKSRYHLPVHGEWLVFNGGYSPKSSHSWELLGQRFALDLVKADPTFCRHSGSGMRLEQYYCYSQDILAAADGRVVGVENRVSDAPFVGWGFSDFTARHFAGSHVIIQHAEGEFALYAHLIKGSICVRTGDQVKRGERIGQCGHSGHSSEPHLHFHLQDSPSLFQGMGLPVTFCDLHVDGKNLASGYIRATQRVRNASHVATEAPKT